MSKRLTVLCLILSGCGGEVTPVNPQVLDTSSPDIIRIDPPVPSPSPSHSTCATLPLFREWNTTAQPNNKILGIYDGPPTNGPIYTLDLSALQYGNNFATLPYDTSHVCYYDLTINANSFVVHSLQGCAPGVIPPGHPVNEQCNYCPGGLEANPSALEWTFTFELTCEHLKIHDVTHNQTVCYE